MTTAGVSADPLPVGADLAALCAEFADRLMSAGLVWMPKSSARSDPASASAQARDAGSGFSHHLPAERVAWWAQAVLVARPTLVSELYWLGRVTLVDRMEQLAGYDEIFDQVFGGRVNGMGQRAMPESAASVLPAHGSHRDADSGDDQSPSGAEGPTDGLPPPAQAAADSTADPVRAGAALASETELLLAKDFADCSPVELAELARLVESMRLVAPVRPSGWQLSGRSGRSIDLRRTLRAACRTGGDPVYWQHRRRGTVDRQLVLLADVSGSMQAYSRMYLRVLQGAVMGAKAHAYVFATQLRPVTRTLGRGRREDAIGRALAASPDAAGGTRIGAAVKQFLDTEGRRGLARGAVIVIVSDGWERADPALLAEQMRRLALLAHRVIWVNPRKAAPGFAPLTGGMAAALPHVDAFIAGHSAQSVHDLLDAIAAA